MATSVTPTKHVSVSRAGSKTVVTIQASPPARIRDVIWNLIASALLLVSGLTTFFGAVNIGDTGFTPVLYGLAGLALTGLIFFRTFRRLRSKSGYDIHLDQDSLTMGDKAYDLAHIGNVRLKDSMGTVFFNAYDAREARLKSKAIESGRAARGWEIGILYGDAWITLLGGLSEDAGTAALRQLTGEMRALGWAASDVQSA